MNTYFFNAFLPTLPALEKKYTDLVVKYPDTSRYLYIIALQTVLHEVTSGQQKEFMVALESSENLAEKWIATKPELVSALMQQLERSILSLS